MGPGSDGCSIRSRTAPPFTGLANHRNASTIPPSSPAILSCLALNLISEKFCSGGLTPPDRKSTPLNTSHPPTSHAVFFLKKKKKPHTHPFPQMPTPPPRL